MRRAYRRLAIATGAGLLLAGGAVAAERAYWRPVVPGFTIEVRTSAARTPSLILLYGEEGADPFRPGPLGADRRITACRAQGTLCTSEPARYEFHAVATRRQSLQIRRFDAKGNGIVGGIIWDGPAYPERVRLRCDLTISDPRKSCVMTGTSR